MCTYKRNKIKLCKLLSQIIFNLCLGMYIILYVCVSYERHFIILIKNLINVSLKQCKLFEFNVCCKNNSTCIICIIFKVRILIRRLLCERIVAEIFHSFRRLFHNGRKLCKTYGERFLCFMPHIDL